jgi:hypothetical protein
MRDRRICMKKLWIAAIAVLTAVLVAGPAIRANEKGQKFRAELSGGEEVPAVTTETNGRARIVFNEDETKLEFELRVRKGLRVRQAHIHCAPEGVNGPIIVFLAGNHNPGWDVDGAWVDNATATDANIVAQTATGCPSVITNLRELAEEMRRGNTYVNVHTTANPSGEARGQLEAEDDDRH